MPSAPLPASPANGEDAAALARSARAGLPLVTLGLAIYYVVLGAAHAVVVSPAAGHVLVPVALGTAATLVALRGALSRFARAQVSPHLVNFAIGVLVLANCLAHLAVVPDPKHTLNLCLAVVGGGALMLSLPWFGAFLGLAFAGFGLASAADGLVADRVHYAFALCGSAALGLLILLVRRSSVIRYARVEAELQQRHAELEGALRTAECELVNRGIAEGEAKRSRAALDESERHHRAIVENALDCVIAIDEQGLVREFNPSAERVFGYRRQETLGRPLGDLIVPSSQRSAHAAGMRRVLETGVSKLLGRRVEVEALRSDGAHIPVELAITAVEERGRKGFIGFARDITEIQRTRELLARERQMLRAVSVAQATYIAGGNAQSALEALLAQTVALTRSRVGWLVERVRHGTHGGRLEPRAAVGGGADALFERLAPLLDEAAVCGRSRSMNSEELGTAVALPVRSSGEIVALVGLCGREDPYEGDAEAFLGPLMQTCASLFEAARGERRRRQTESALRESEARYRAISEHTLDVIFEVDRGGRILFASPSTRTLLAHSPAALIGRSLAEVLHPDDRPTFAAALARVFDDPSACLELTLRLRYGDEEWRWLEMAGRTYRAANGQPRIVVVSRDVTERKDIEDRLDEARKAEASIAERIQQTLLLGQAPVRLKGVSVAALGLASESVAGDFYDFLQPAEGCLDVLVGDVMGKGVPAALIGAATKAQFLRALAAARDDSAPGTLPPPSALVHAVHRELTPRLVDLESFVTLSYARFDLRRRELLLVDCGHAKPVHRRARDGRCTLLEGRNLPLGIVEDEEHLDVRVAFGPGDCFVLYSDGITEAPGPDEAHFGVARLVSLIDAHGGDSPEELIHAIRAAVLRYSGGRDLADDLTCVVVQIAPEADDRAGMPARLAVRSHLEELATIRAFVEEVVRRVWTSPDDEPRLAQLVLAVNEAASNVMRHAYAGRTEELVEIEIEADAKRTKVRLFDTGPAFVPVAPALPAPEISEHGGFGLYIIHESVDEVRYLRDPDGRNRLTLVQSREGPDSALGARSEIASCTEP
jgi:PAS domain S-box-containing protein